MPRFPTSAVALAVGYMLPATLGFGFDLYEKRGKEILETLCVFMEIKCLLQPLYSAGHRWYTKQVQIFQPKNRTEKYTHKQFFQQEKSRGSYCEIRNKKRQKVIVKCVKKNKEEEQEEKKNRQKRKGKRNYLVIPIRRKFACASA